MNRHPSNGNLTRLWRGLEDRPSEPDSRWRYSSGSTSRVTLRPASVMHHQLRISAGAVDAERAQARLQGRGPSADDALRRRPIPRAMALQDLAYRLFGILPPFMLRPSPRPVHSNPPEQLCTECHGPTGRCLGERSAPPNDFYSRAEVTASHVVSSRWRETRQNGERA
jgi:hypothetical protein